ncbi:MAG: hypothetical protein JKY42_11915 [Flavobacteriales bacterium]|nr:hypothetical protein [Flavobacteriales bacterium]
MKKDIIIPKVEDIVLAIVQEENDQKQMEWNVYLINLKPEEIYGVLVSSKGYGKKEGETVKTSMLRHFLDKIPANSFKKVEPIQEELFGLSNEYWLSFYYKSVMYDKKYIFLAESVQEKHLTIVPVINKRGVMIR